MAFWQNIQLRWFQEEHSGADRHYGDFLFNTGNNDPTLIQRFIWGEKGAIDGERIKILLERKGTGIRLVCANAFEEEIETIPAGGVDEFVRKPFSDEHFFLFKD